VCVALAPIKEITCWLLLLVAVDLVTGVAKAVRAGDFVTSRSLRDTVAKVGPYLLALLAAFSLDRLIGDADPTLARIASVALGSIEIKSIGENLKAITGIDLLGNVIDKLKPKG
jgi:hypothetical protein